MIIKRDLDPNFLPNEQTKVPLKMKFGYGSGDFALNLGYQVCALFLIYYFTDVFMISAAAAGSIFLFSKLWDAVSDPLMGIISDHTKSRWGRKRPYLLFGSFPLGLAVFLLFFGPDLSETMRIVYGAATFILFCTAITVVTVPYGAMTADLTLDTTERNTISGFRMTFALLGTLFAAAVTKPLVMAFADEATGFRIIGAVYGVIVAVVILITFATVRERVAHVDEKKQPFKENLRVIFANKPFLLLAASTTLYMITVNMLAAVVNYYFKYNLKAEGLIPIAFLALFVTAALCIPIFVIISNRFGKKIGYNIGMSTLGFALVAIFFLGEKSMALTMILFVLAGVGMSSVFLFPWSIVPDTVEYSEWKTGLRREGTLYGFYFFCFKLGSAIAGFLAGWGLNIAGYVANVEQSAGSLMGIRILITFVPLIFIILGMILISFFPIDEKMHRQIVAQISKRGT